MPNDTSTAEVLRETFLRILAGAHVSSPGLVVSSTGGLLEVTPMIARYDESGAAHVYPNIKDVPVLLPGGGGWTIEVTPTVGDIVWLIFSDHSLAEWKQQKTSVSPKAKRSHALTDAVALPTNFGSAAGSTLKISNALGTVAAEFGTVITLTGNVEVTGTLRIGTAIPATAITVNTHTHSIPDGTSGPPNPG